MEKGREGERDAQVPSSLTVTLLIRMLFLESILAPQELNKVIGPLELIIPTLGNY